MLPNKTLQNLDLDLKYPHKNLPKKSMKNWSPNSGTNQKVIGHFKNWHIGVLRPLFYAL